MITLTFTEDELIALDNTIASGHISDDSLPVVKRIHDAVTELEKAMAVLPSTPNKCAFVVQTRVDALVLKEDDCKSRPQYFAKFWVSNAEIIAPLCEPHMHQLLRMRPDEVTVRSRA